MVVYLLVFIGIAFLCFREVFIGSIDKNSYVGLFVCLILGMFSGSRYKMGGSDYEAYEYYFIKVPTRLRDIWDNNFEDYLLSSEKGYLYLNSVFKYFYDDFNVFLLFIGITTSIFLYFILKKYSVYFFLTLLLFLSKGYLYYFFTAQRQIIAMIICWYAIKFIVEKKFFIFVSLIVLASLLHSSALFFLPVYFIDRYRLSNKNVFLILIFSVTFSIFNVGLYIGRLVASLIPFGGNKLSIYLEGYSNGVNILNYLEIIPLLFIILHNRSRLSLSSKYFNIFFNIFIVYIVMTIAFYDFSFIARLKGYFVLGYIIIFSQVVDIVPNKKYKFGILFLLIIYALLIYSRELLTFDNGEGYLPYRSFLFM